MRFCNFCNGKLFEIDDIGTEECEKCGTTYALLGKRGDEDESSE